MPVELFAPASAVAKEGNGQDEKRSDLFAVIVWSVVFLFWVVACVGNWVTGGEWSLPDVPAGITGLLAALPVSKAITFLRR